MPKKVEDNPCLYCPGIKWDVRRGSFTHLTEFFGPVLAVMPFRSLSEAIEIVNETGYGLTSGLESLDDREQTEWLAGIRAGNLYVNRSTTGAIVLRQPFGGMGKSAFGPGIKAGGPNYVAQLMHFEHRDHAEGQRIEDQSLLHLVEGLRVLSGPLAADTDRLSRAIADYDGAARDEFLRQHDHFRLIGQDNLRRYLPVQSLCIRVTNDDTWFDIVARAAAARSVGCRAIVSAAPGVHEEALRVLHDLTEQWAADIEFIEQTDDDLVEAIEWGGIGRLRYACPTRVPDGIRRAVIGRYVHIADTPVLPVGRVELLWYVQEQSLCIDYHRYGNLGIRAGEERASV
jgi:RHH-type proline utilization regulon transcriptional repressor/proline dehydrogenase/delta 1-pyrroline-5-carboxylate dehydrogenase